MVKLKAGKLLSLFFPLILSFICRNFAHEQFTKDAKEKTIVEDGFAAKKLNLIDQLNITTVSDLIAINNSDHLSHDNEINNRTPVNMTTNLTGSTIIDSRTSSPIFFASNSSNLNASFSMNNGSKSILSAKAIFKKGNFTNSNLDYLDPAESDENNEFDYGSKYFPEEVSLYFHIKINF